MYPCQQRGRLTRGRVRCSEPPAPSGRFVGGRAQSSEILPTKPGTTRNPAPAPSGPVSLLACACDNNWAYGRLSPRGETTPVPFSDYRDNFDPETLAILEIAFNESWEVLRASGGNFDQKATREALAELIHQLRG